MAKEFVSTIGDGLMFPELVAWEAQMDDWGDLTSAAFITQDVSGQTGDCVGYECIGQTTGHKGTVRYAKTGQVLATMATAGNNWANGEQVLRNAENYFTAAGAADSVIQVAEITGEITLSGELTISGFTTDTTNRIIIRSTGKKRRSANDPLRYGYAHGRILHTGGGTLLTIGVNHIDIEDVDLYRSAESAGNAIYQYSAAAGSVVNLRRVVVRSEGTTGGRALLLATDSDIVVNAVNCAFYTNTHARVVSTTVGNLNLDYCVISAQRSAGCAGVYCDTNATVTARNCYANHCGGSAAWYIGGTVSLTTCGSSDATGSESLQNLAPGDQFESITEGSEDFHLLDDSKLIGAATTIDGVYDDIYGTARPEDESSIGPYEIPQDEGLSVFASIGTCTVTGLTATILTAVVVTASLGSCTVAGHTAGIVMAGMATAQLGACTITGYTASAHVESEAPGGLDIALRDPGASAFDIALTESVGDQTVTAQLGTCAVTGHTAAVSAAVAVAGQLGACTVAGYTAGVSTAGTVTTDAGTCVVAGHAATIATAVIIAGQLGTCAVAGHTAAIQTAVAATADAGACTVAGHTAAVSAAVTVAGQLGTCTVAGHTATVTVAGTAVGELGACTVAGHTATVATAVTVTASLGSCTVAGLTAIATAAGAPQQVTADLGTCTVAGHTASPATAVTVAASLGSCAVEGHTAAVAASGAPQQAVGALGACTVAGNDAAVTTAVTVPAAAGSCVVSGHTATAIVIGPPQTVSAQIGACIVTGLAAAASTQQPQSVLVANSRLALVLVTNSRC